MTFLDMGRALAEHFGRRYPFPRRELPKPHGLAGRADGRRHPQVRGEQRRLPAPVRQQRARENLGIEFRPVETTVIDHFQQLIDDGIVRDKRR